MRTTLIITLLVVILFTPLVYASEAVRPEVTIDSPPEVIAEDFVRVAVAPKPWVYRLWSWLGTDQVDVRNLTDVDFEKHIRDEVKREQVKQVYQYFKKLETFKNGDRLEKWQKNVYLRGNDHPVINAQIHKVLEQIEFIPNLNVYFPKSVNEIKEPNWSITDEDWNQNSSITPIVGTLAITLFGEKHDEVICQSCNDETINKHYIARYFKPNKNFVVLTYDAGPEDILEHITEFGYENLDGDNVLVDVILFATTHEHRYLFENTKGSRFHVEGWLDRFKAKLPEHKVHDNELTAECRIYLFHSEEVMRALTTECILRSLGLLNLSRNLNANLGPRAERLEEVKWITDPTEYDLLLLRILYDEKIKPGMTREEALPIAKQIIEEIKSERIMDNN